MVNTKYRGLMIAVAVLLIIVLIGPVLAWGMMGSSTVGWGMMGPGMMGGYAGPPSAVGGWPWGVAMLLGWLAMIAFWGALIAGVVLLVRWLAAGSGAGHAGVEAPDAPAPGGVREQEPLDILRRRYASGEITQDEFERVRQSLAA